MLTLQLPMLLALLGTALMAVVIFAPARTAARVTVSCAPPFAPPPVERWFAPPEALEPWAVVEPWPVSEPPRVVEARATDSSRPVIEPPDTAIEALPEAAPSWPTLIDPRAAGCDAGARLALVEALATVRAPWSAVILGRALDDEPDLAVRDALLAALDVTLG